MVKIPGLDNLKKVGSDLLDSAKTVNIGGYVDKIKSGVDSMRKGSAEVPQGDEAIKTQFEAVYATIKELSNLRDAEDVAIKKLQSQVSDLAKIVIATQTPPPAATTTEETK